MMANLTTSSCQEWQRAKLLAQKKSRFCGYLGEVNLCPAQRSRALTRFQGCLADLAQIIKEAAQAQDRKKAEQLFPQIGYWRSAICYSPDYMDEWDSPPDHQQELVREGKISLVNSFFEYHLPELEEYVLPHLFRSNTTRARRAYRKFYGGLSKIRQYYNRSRQGIGERAFYEEDIAEAVSEFNRALPFSSWNLANESISFDKLDRLIEYAKQGLEMFIPKHKSGRPPKPFNILVFHIIDAFTFRYLDRNGKPVMRDGKYRLIKNWQLVCASLLWLRAANQIPELEEFIAEYKEEKAEVALRGLISTVKMEYQNLRRYSRGMGKLAEGLGVRSHYIGVNIPYISEHERGIIKL